MAKKPVVKNPQKDPLDEAINEASLDEVPVQAHVGAVEAGAPIETVKVQVPVTKRALQQKGRMANLTPVRIASAKQAPNELSESDKRLVEVVVDEVLHINGKRLYGRVIMEAHQAQSIIPMLQAKKRMDIEVHTGKNFLIKRDSSNTLHVRELGGGDE